MTKLFAALLGLGIAFGPSALSHHKYAPNHAGDKLENGHLSPTENTENTYGSHGKNVPHVHQ
jgi:hypothetical protein